MRPYIRITAPAVLVALGLAACDHSVLDLTPEDEISEDAVFTDPNLAEAFLNDVYIGMGHGFNEVMLASVTDETMFTHVRGTDRVLQALVNSSDAAALGDGRYVSHYMWGDNYSRIKQANTLLNNIDEADFDEALKQRLKGEAFFLRAYFYHNLMRMFGGVPIITNVFELDDDFEIARNSFDETVDFIVADADSAAALLPVVHASEDVGRATKGAALALKARVLLYAASDLYDENPSSMPETGYTSAQDRQALWRAAKGAAQAVVDLGVYGLFRPAPSDPEQAAQNYNELFLQKTSEEVIMSRFFTIDRDENDAGLFNGPNGYHNWGGNTPIQSLIDDYLMIDGSAFDWSNPAHAGAPYENRDPRFYASILHDGASWRERPSDVQELDPNNRIQTFTALTLPDGTVVPGLDTRDGPVEDWNGSFSGYYLRKFMDPAINHQFSAQDVPWIFFRYAEILLNYAEASIELGELADARGVLDEIRRRAGMPELDAGMSRAELRETYRNERRIEMAFEEQRFFDVRRWMTASEELDEDARGIEILLEGDSRTDPSTWTNDRYEIKVVQQRAWDDKVYFAPILREEINRNSLLVQNPGY